MKCGSARTTGIPSHLLKCEVENSSSVEKNHESNAVGLFDFLKNMYSVYLFIFIYLFLYIF